MREPKANDGGIDIKKLIIDKSEVDTCLNRTELFLHAEIFKSNLLVDFSEISLKNLDAFKESLPRYDRRWFKILFEVAELDLNGIPAMLAQFLSHLPTTISALIL